MIGKAVVLCAGEGSRLRPLTFSRPKHLLPVAGRPILGWALEAIRAVGITEVALVIGHQGEAIRRYVGAGDDWGLNVKYIRQLTPLGIGHAVDLARDWVDGQPFLVYLGDNLFGDGLGEFMATLSNGGWEAALMLKRVADPWRFGVAEVSGERVVRVLEKPKDPPSDLAIVGVYAFRSSIFEAIHQTEPSGRGEMEITDAIQRLVTQAQTVRYTETEGVWEDTGEPMSLLGANQRWLADLETEVAGETEACEITGALQLGSGSRARNCTFEGPCLVGHNCVLENASIGPNVTIGDGCAIEDTRLRNCVVQRDTQIRHLTSGLVDSVLGEQVELQGRPDEPPGAPLSLLLGDMAHIKAM